MRRTLAWVVIAGCSSAPPKAERVYYEVTAGSTFDGAATAAITLDASFADGPVILFGARRGYGLRNPNGTYDMVFYRYVPAAPTFPPQRHDDETSLLVIHPDGRGVLARLNHQGAAFRSTLQGEELVLDGPPVGHTVIHLHADGTATLTGDMIARSAVYARFDDDLLIAVSPDVAYSDLSVGRYDFTRGRGENASSRGRGIETFTRSR